MTPGIEKLTYDSEILTAMASEMDSYLKSDVLFWNLSAPGMPRLTLGGYLLREQRLLALLYLLDEPTRAQVETAVTHFNQALVEKIVRFEQKAHVELDARLRQWREFLRDVEQGVARQRSNYATAVEPRAMLAALIDRLGMPPYRLQPEPVAQLAALDAQLRRAWEAGDFIWPEEWQPAYPRLSYWWLYGQPKEKPRPEA